MENKAQNKIRDNICGQAFPVGVGLAHVALTVEYKCKSNDHAWARYVPFHSDNWMAKLTSNKRSRRMKQFYGLQCKRQTRNIFCWVML